MGDHSSGGEFGADQTKKKYVISLIVRNLTCYEFKPAYARLGGGCEQHFGVNHQSLRLSNLYND